MISGMLRSRCIVIGESFLKRNFNVLRQTHQRTLPSLNILLKSKYSTGQNDSPTQSEIIYNGALSKQIRAVKIFSLSSSIIGVIGQPVIYSKSLEIGGTPVMVAICGVVGFFTFVTPFLLHLITKKYVIYMSYNKDSNIYTATLVNFFLIRKKVNFTSTDVIVPDVPGLFTTFLAHKIPMFVDPNGFKNTDHFIKIMGFDKPIDFNLNDLIKKPDKETSDSKK
ncbi:transmembrane protein 70 homolog, mitochondrial [Arctopsyche grandis]|uniref:transmembrane protein 70 homolog, mitochondrial n=1 Tax=Arctopsyche grandis TaxID=121162 RepID=UPI00406D8F4A